MSGFKNEMYVERGKTIGSFFLHFYKQMRAKDALTFIMNTPNQFTNVELILHKREIGTNQEPIKGEEKEEQKSKAKVRDEVDEDGFTIVKKKKK